jgi:hypothetical protein
MGRWMLMPRRCAAGLDQRIRRSIVNWRRRRAGYSIDEAHDRLSAADCMCAIEHTRARLLPWLCARSQCFRVLPDEQKVE